MSTEVKVFKANNFQTMDWWGVFRDMFAGLKLWRIWTTLSWQEFKATYKRSIFGILWVMASFAGFVFVKLIVFSSLIKTEDGQFYNTFMTLGLFLWMYFLSVVNSAPSTFISTTGWIKSEPLPFSLYVFKNIMREFYNFGFTFLVVIAAFIYLNFTPPVQSYYALPAIVFYALNAIWIKLFFGTIGARFRDIGYFITAVTLPMMFLTPVFWMPSQMPGLMKYMWWNPFYHYLEIFRAPMLTGTFPIESWVFVMILFGIGWLATIISFARLSHRIVFWL